jgi:O-antigen/teichoic acid export membrane protein
LSDAARAERLSTRRHRGVLLATLGGTVARGASVVYNLISVPLLAHHLGLETYGFWLTISAAFSWFSVSDLGLGVVVKTRLAREGSTRSDASVVLLTATILLVSSMAVLCFAGLGFWLAFGDPAQTFRAPSGLPTTTARLAVVLTAGLAVGSLLLSTGYRALEAMQQGWIASCYDLASTVGSAIGLLVCVKTDGGLIFLALATGLPPLVAATIAYWWIGPPLPRMLHAIPDALRILPSLLRDGVWVLGVNVQAMLWLAKDAVLIGIIVGVAAVPPFQTTFRIYSLLLSLIASRVGASLWPAYAEAIKENDWEWVSRASARYKRVCLAAYLGIGALITVTGPLLVKVWAGSQVAAPSSVFWLMFVEFGVLSWSNMDGNLLLAAGRYNVVALTGLIGGTVATLLGIIALHQSGAAALIGVNASCLLVFVATPIHLLAQRTVNQRRQVFTPIDLRAAEGA